MQVIFFCLCEKIWGILKQKVLEIMFAIVTTREACIFIFRNFAKTVKKETIYFCLIRFTGECSNSFFSLKEKEKLQQISLFKLIILMLCATGVKLITH